MSGWGRSRIYQLAPSVGQILNETLWLIMRSCANDGDETENWPVNPTLGGAQAPSSRHLTNWFTKMAAVQLDNVQQPRAEVAATWNRRGTALPDPCAIDLSSSAFCDWVSGRSSMTRHHSTWQRCPETISADGSRWMGKFMDLIQGRLTMILIHGSSFCGWRQRIGKSDNAVESSRSGDGGGGHCDGAMRR